MAEAGTPLALIGVDEALIRLTDAVSDEQAATQRANLDEANKLLGRDSAPKFEPPTPEIAELLRQAPLHWMRREVAIKLLNDALRCGDLRLFIRKPDGTLIQLTSAEWKANPRREILISGIWHDSAGSRLLEYDGQPVLLAETAFWSWCERVAPSMKAESIASASSGATASIHPAPPAEPTTLTMSPTAVDEKKPPFSDAIDSEPLASANSGDTPVQPITSAPSAVEETPKSVPASQSKRSRRKSATRAKPQQFRARKVLDRLFPDGYPATEDVSDVDLLNVFTTEYNEWVKTEKPKSRFGKPSDATVLREVGRKE
jgi:hypothetical protein